MIRRPPRSTLFPTRRSSDLVDEHGNRPPHCPRELEHILEQVAIGTAETNPDVIVIEDKDTEVGRFHLSPIDRKSTRLNSSHPSISYAVFCLKKKKNGGRSVT